MQLCSCYIFYFRLDIRRGKWYKAICSLLMFHIPQIVFRNLFRAWVIGQNLTIVAKALFITLTVLVLHFAVFYLAIWYHRSS